MGHGVPNPVGVTHTIGLELLLNHHPSRHTPPRTQFSANREGIARGKPTFAPSLCLATGPRHWGNDVRHPGRRALGLMASGATCVQRLDGSRDSAIHTKYRISLRSSSMQEPRYPLPRVFWIRVSQRHRTAPSPGRRGRAGQSLFPWRIRRRGFVNRPGGALTRMAPPDTRGTEAPCTTSRTQAVKQIHGSHCFVRIRQ